MSGNYGNGYLKGESHYTVSIYITIILLLSCYRYSLCMLFVFSALLEFAVVNILSRHEDRKPPPRPREPSESDPEIGEMGITSADATEEDVRAKITIQGMFCKTLAEVSRLIV